MVLNSADKMVLMKVFEMGDLKVDLKVYLLVVRWVYLKAEKSESK